ncbi:PREDICTED: C-type mannose receptor 2-like isoform X1 [Poecilia mexicana]|uniref:C-type mannose receptor 2-like isoform X1 n=1 Tax=Poecilia mexicana TaxID=48701 RepID=UPI00072DEDE0|nr:PREDICTED: C-type mannose receptor 2-like isoform X1 [Poecilia mexicana]
MTWADAQSYCRRMNSDLATIATMEDMKTLNKMAVMNNMVYTSYSYRAWIGLYDDVDSWRWSLSDSGFYRTGEDSFRKWQSGEPNNWMSTERCGMMTGEGLWQDGPCSSARRPVCANITGPGVSFVLVQSGMNWTEAQSFCRKQYSDLASIRNESENQQVQQLVPAGTKVWTGLYRDGWKWSAGSRSSFSYWKSTEPNNSNGNEKCVLATFDALGKWEDWRCDVEKAFICSSTVVFQKVVSVKLEKTSGLDLNSAAVMEELLSQVRGSHFLPAGGAAAPTKRVQNVVFFFISTSSNFRLLIM